MPDILHRIGILSESPQPVYEALTSLPGLRSWWTDSVKGEGTVGGSLHFRFGDRGGFDMRVIELVPSARVLWEVIGGPEEWLGTRVRFDLHQADGHTIVLFKHEDWKEPVEFMHHCSTKWAIFLMSLKSLLETGRGAPYPRDVKIDNWN
jgi:uncharacterized protein YndB with AHSA1/START domain